MLLKHFVIQRIIYPSYIQLATTELGIHIFFFFKKKQKKNKHINKQINRMYLFDFAREIDFYLRIRLRPLCFAFR